MTREAGGQFKDTLAVKTIARSSLILKDVKEKYEKTPDGFYKVTKYVSREVVRVIFELRKQRIREHLKIAEQEISVTSVNLALALKHYYWALLLADICPDTMQLTLGSATTENLPSSSILQRLNSVLRSITFKPVKQIPSDMYVWRYSVEINGKSISEMKYEIYDGDGQTMYDIRNGSVQMTFNYSSYEQERTTTALIEYAYENEMDELLLTARNLRKGKGVTNSISVSIPGTGKKTEPPAKRAVPKPIEDLLACADNPEKFKSILNELLKKGKIIVGSDNDFEKFDGLYSILIGKDKSVVILYHEKNRFYSITTGEEVDLHRHAGKQRTWVKVN
jgi:hypothetical protein